MVLLPTPVHGDVHDPPVPWHLICPIEPLLPQENILQAAMQLAEPHFPFLPPIQPLEWQEAIVQLAEMIRHCDVEGGGVSFCSSCAIENASGESVPVTSRF